MTVYSSACVFVNFFIGNHIYFIENCFLAVEYFCLQLIKKNCMDGYKVVNPLED